MDQTLPIFLLYMRQTWKELSFFNSKAFCYSYAWSWSLCEGGTSFPREVSIESSEDSYFCFRLALLHSFSCFFFLFQLLSSSLWTIFDAISSNIDKVLSINPYEQNVFVFRNFNVQHKYWLTYSGGTHSLNEFYYKRPYSNS